VPARERASRPLSRALRRYDASLRAGWLRYAVPREACSPWPGGPRCGGGRSGSCGATPAGSPSSSARLRDPYFTVAVKTSSISPRVAQVGPGVWLRRLSVQMG